MPGVECFEDNLKLKAIIGCAGNQLHSTDEAFIVFSPYTASTPGLTPLN